MKDAISLMGEGRRRYTNVAMCKVTLARWLDIVSCAQVATFGAMLEAVFLTSRMHTSIFVEHERLGIINKNIKMPVLGFFANILARHIIFR